MFIPDDKITIGSKICLKSGSKIVVSSGVFIGPHDFIIKDVNDDGWCIIDKQCLIDIHIPSYNMYDLFDLPEAPKT